MIIEINVFEQLDSAIVVIIIYLDFFLFIVHTGEDLKPHPYGVLCTAKWQIVTDTAHLKCAMV